MLIGNTATHTWVKFVKEAQKSAHCTLPEMFETYLVHMLQRFTEKTDLGTVPLAIQYLETVKKGPHVQNVLLRDTADESLIMAGLFPERARRLNVSPSYFMDMSMVCFGKLSIICEQLKHRSDANDFQELRDGVPHLAEILYYGRGWERVKVPW